MTKISAAFEIGNSMFEGVDTCGICSFKTFKYNDKPCRCMIFKREIEEYCPFPELEFHKEYKRLQECINSEIEG